MRRTLGRYFALAVPAPNTPWKVAVGERARKIAEGNRPLWIEISPRTVGSPRVEEEEEKEDGGTGEGEREGRE